MLSTVLIGALPSSASAAEACRKPPVFPKPQLSEESLNRPLLELESYDPTKLKARKLRSLFMNLMTWGADHTDRFKFKPSDAHDTVISSLRASANDLKGYFVDSEFVQIGKDIEHWFKQNLPIVGSNGQATRAVREGTRKTTERVMERVFEREDVDPVRRKAWIEKILAPFDDCSDKAETYFQAKACADTFTNLNLSANIGLAILHEKARNLIAPSVSNFSKLLNESDARYRACWKKQQKTKPCVLEALKPAISEVAAQQLRLNLASQFFSEKRLNSTLKDLQKTFDTCIAPADEKDDFNACSDKIALAAAQRAIPERLTFDPKLIENVPAENDRKTLATEKKAEFKACFNRQIKNKCRSEGTLDISPCIDLITNNVTDKIANEQIVASIRSNFATDPSDDEPTQERARAAIAATTKEARLTFDGCWDKYQDETKRENCLRETAKSVAKGISSRLVTAETDPALTANSPDFPSNVLANFDACVEKELPTAITKIRDVASVLEPCSGTLRREAAEVIAPHRLALALQSQLQPDVIDEISVRNLKQFFNDIGKQPSDAVLKQGIITLKKEVANDAAFDRLPDEIRKALPYAETTELRRTLNLKSDAISADVIQHFRWCTEEKLTVSQFKQSDANIELCFKTAASEITDSMADLQLGAQILPLYQGKEEQGKKLVDQLKKELNRCVTRSEQSISLNNFIDRILFCKEKLTDRAVFWIAQDKVKDMQTELERQSALAVLPSYYGNVFGCNEPDATPFMGLQKQSDDIMVLMSEAIRLYVAYDFARAGKDIEATLAKVGDELRTRTPAKERERLVDWLLENTEAFDQLIKAMTLQQVVDTLGHLPASDRLSKAALAKLTSPETLNRVFATPAGKQIIQDVGGLIAKPVLAQGQSPKSPSIVAAKAMIDRRIKNLLVDSSEFGDVVIADKIQQTLDSQPWYKRWGATLIYGGDSLDWKTLKSNDKGAAAEAYIRNEILRPKVLGKPLSKNEIARRLKHAESMVQDAMAAHAKPAPREVSGE